MRRCSDGDMIANKAFRYKYLYAYLGVYNSCKYASISGKSKQLIRSIAPSGNLFLLLLLQELRHQGITFIAFYALQRVIESTGDLRVSAPPGDGAGEL